MPVQNKLSTHNLIAAFIAARMIRGGPPPQDADNDPIDNERYTTRWRENLINDAIILSREMASITHMDGSLSVDVEYERPYPPGNIACDFVELCIKTDMSFSTTHRGVRITHNPPLPSPPAVSPARKVHRG